MSALQMFTRFWRVPVVALLSAVLAFGGSFLISETYESTTKLLVRGRDTTFLSATGNSLDKQGGVLDSAIAAGLSDTQTAMLSSRVVAEAVVDELGLDRPRVEEPGLVPRIRRLVGDLYRNTKALLIYGFVADVDQRTRAVEGVHRGLGAAQVEDSYVIELTAQANSPALAAAIADTAADALIKLGRARFETESSSYREFLGEQVERAEAAAESAAEQVRAFKAEHGIADVGIELGLTAESAQSLRRDLRSAEIDLEAARAEVAAISHSLAGAPTGHRSVQNIENENSSTRVVSDGASVVHESLHLDEARAGARVASLEARMAGIQRALDGGTIDRDLTQEEADLRRLESRYLADSAAFQELNALHQQAVLSSAGDRAELTRVDSANLPVYPIKPGRYLYLALGLVTGAALGLMWTVLVGRREGWWNAIGVRIAGTSAAGAGTAHSNGHVLIAPQERNNHDPAAPGERQRVAMGRFEAFRPDSEE